MPTTSVILGQFFQSVAGLALLSILYGVASRRIQSGASRQVAFGVTFGVASLIALANPMMLAPGVQVDMRALPIAFAGAFGGPLAMAIALVMGATMRLAIGGGGAIAGVASMMLAGLAGLWWARTRTERSGKAFASLVLLGTAISVNLVSAFLLPFDMAVEFLRRFAPAMAGFNIAGTLVIGGAIERERVLALSERDLSRSASRDALTGVPNRRGFHQLVEAARSRGAPQGGSAVMVLDLDHFKRVNDTHGHAAGDAILVETGRRLQAELRATDVLGRFGGEEFVVLVSSVSKERAGLVAERLCRSIGERLFHTGGTTLHVTVSVGAHWFGGDDDIDDVMRRADVNLYAAKERGRNRIVLGPDDGEKPGRHPAGAAGSERWLAGEPAV